MDSQVVARLTLLGAITTMVALAAVGDAAPVVVFVIGVPLAFVAGGLILLALPYVAVRKAENAPLGFLKFLDAAEHAGILSWLNMFIFWSTTAIAFMGLFEAGPVYVMAFFLAFAIGLFAALRDLYLSEEPDVQQSPWQRHPNS